MARLEVEERGAQVQQRNGRIVGARRGEHRQRQVRVDGAEHLTERIANCVKLRGRFAG